MVSSSKLLVFKNTWLTDHNTMQRRKDMCNDLMHQSGKGYTVHIPVFPGVDMLANSSQGLCTAQINYKKNLKMQRRILRVLKTPC